MHMQTYWDCSDFATDHINSTSNVDLNKLEVILQVTLKRPNESHDTSTSVFHDPCLYVSVAQAIR